VKSKRQNTARRSSHREIAVFVEVRRNVGHMW
jgi:hypothetical protein